MWNVHFFTYVQYGNGQGNQSDCTKLENIMLNTYGLCWQHCHPSIPSCHCWNLLPLFHYLNQQNHQLSAPTFYHLVFCSTVWTKIVPNFHIPVDFNPRLRNLEIVAVQTEPHSQTYYITSLMSPECSRKGIMSSQAKKERSKNRTGTRHTKECRNRRNFCNLQKIDRHLLSRCCCWC